MFPTFTMEEPKRDLLLSHLDAFCWVQSKTIVYSRANGHSGTYYLGTVGPFMMTLLKARIAAAVIYKTIDEVDDDGDGK